MCVCICIARERGTNGISEMLIKIAVNALSKSIVFVSTIQSTMDAWMGGLAMRFYCSL